MDPTMYLCARIGCLMRLIVLAHWSVNRVLGLIVSDSSPGIYV